MNTSNTFAYAPENLFLYHLDWVQFGIFVGAGLVAMMVFYYFGIYLAYFRELMHEHREFQKKKRVLGDLILMKEIQTELEKEIERATLKATFQS